jgi:hypothetical protein
MCHGQPSCRLAYSLFATFWDAGVKEKGESYFRRPEHVSGDPSLPIYQEADLVFELPTESVMQGLAIVRRTDPTDVLAVSLSGPDAKWWPKGQQPDTF